MTRKPRVIVIGAGVAGLSAAMHCVQLGAGSVTVLERAEFASGSSALSAGIFNQQSADPFDQEMRTSSIAILEKLEAQGLLRLNRCGYLRLARTAEQWEQTQTTFTTRPVERTRLLTRQEVAELVPGMRVDDVHGAMFGPRDGHMDGTEVCQAFLTQGRANGVRLVQRAPVTGMTRRAATRVVHTQAGDHEADLVINAAGGWATRVGELLECPVEVINQRHQIAIIAVPSLSGIAIPTVQTYFPGSSEDAVYVRPEGPGQFIGGLHSYESEGGSADPDTYKRSFDQEILESLAERLADRFPGWEDATLRPGWTGLYPLSPDGRFIIGPHPNDQQVIVLAGLGGVGLTVSGSAGALAADWAMRGKPHAVSAATATAYLPERLENR